MPIPVEIITSTSQTLKLLCANSSYKDIYLVVSFLSSPLFVSGPSAFLSLHLQLYSSSSLGKDLIQSSLALVKTEKESRVCAKSLTLFYHP